MNTLDQFVFNQTAKMRRLWYESSDQAPDFPHSFSPIQKKENEEAFSTELNYLAETLEKPIHSEGQRAEISAHIAKRLKNLGKQIFSLDERQVGTMENEGIPDISTQFFQSARQFDPSLPVAHIFQASRNVWTMNYLQVLLDLPVRLTPSVFAYSMLYPVSDNYLDNPRLSRGEKVRFCQNFAAWLRGEDATAFTSTEMQVKQLVRMFESEFSRVKYPQVYDSLLAIHIAQEKSMRLPTAPVLPNTCDVLGVSIEKGGTSVLADGVLAAGQLNPRQMEIIFNYGVFAQFMDDQEDVDEDLSQNSLSVFSEVARGHSLDLTMNRLFAFSREILKGLDEFSHPRSIPLRELSMKGIDLLLIDACTRTSRHYSRSYLAYLEQFFPFRFVYLREVRKNLKHRKISLERVMHLMLPGESNPVPDWVNASWQVSRAVL